MGEFIVELAGTPGGETLAIALALISALAHAVFGAITKGGLDPYFNRGAINITYSAMAAPFALFVLPWPDAELFEILFIGFFIHLLYEWLQTTSYAKGAFVLVYPIARGTGPIAIAFGALLIFGETLVAVQWFGLALLSGSIFLLAYVNYRNALAGGQNISGLREAVAAAFFTGIMIAVYTTVDAYGIRLAQNPFTFLAWFFMLGGIGFPLIAVRRWMRVDTHPPLSDLAIRGFFGALIGIVTFGSMMLATRLDKVAEVAAIRETSIIFATLIGVLIFKERPGIPALFLIGTIAFGVMLVTAG